LPSAKEALPKPVLCRFTLGLNIIHVILEKFKGLFTDRAVSCLLGCDTPFESQYFDTVIISDYFRILGPTIRQKLILEMSRISKTIIILYTKDFISRVSRNIEGWSWIELPAITSSMEADGLAVTYNDVDAAHGFIIITSR
jgi:hypothetical protein